MKIELLKKVEFDAKYLYVEAGVRSYEDAEVNGVDDENGDLIPCKEGDLWKPIIDIDEGKIINWAQGTTAKIHYKVCDNGSYYLKDADKNIIKSVEQEYVPNCLCPDENGYGDYIIMDVDKDGLIDNWKPHLGYFLDI